MKFAEHIQEDKTKEEACWIIKEYLSGSADLTKGAKDIINNGLAEQIYFEWDRKSMSIKSVLGLGV